MFGRIWCRSALFPIAVSATLGDASAYYILPKITDPRQLIAAQRERSERQASPPETGRLSITSVKRRAQARSRNVLLQQCLPADELERDASSPPASPERCSGRSNHADVAVSPPDEPSGSRSTDSRPGGSSGSGLPQGELPAGDGHLEVDPESDGDSAGAALRRRGLQGEDLGGAERDEGGEDGWPRRGPLVLRGDRAAAAAAKATAREHLVVGEFERAVAVLESAEGLASADDRELPVLLAQARGGATAARGVAAGGRTAWGRVYGTQEPARLAEVRPQKPSSESGARLIHQWICPLRNLPLCAMCELFLTGGLRRHHQSSGRPDWVCHL